MFSVFFKIPAFCRCPHMATTLVNKPLSKYTTVSVQQLLFISCSMLVSSALLAKPVYCCCNLYGKHKLNAKAGGSSHDIYVWEHYGFPLSYSKKGHRLVSNCMPVLFNWSREGLWMHFKHVPECVYKKNKTKKDCKTSPSPFSNLAVSHCRFRLCQRYN